LAETNERTGGTQGEEEQWREEAVRKPKGAREMKQICPKEALTKETRKNDTNAKGRGTEAKKTKPYHFPLTVLI